VIGVARDGEDALRKTLEPSLIRGEPSLAEMPICVITTEGAKEDRERAISLGANEYLTKPIQANKVLAVAKSLLKISD
jgi:two-component system chemotaxis response regulator CheY